MKWSWQIGRFFGIDTQIHASFLLLLLWVVVGALGDGGGIPAATYSVLFLAGVFASVVLHELGHALMGRAFGIRTRRILLLPIGGMAQMEGMPRNPRAELFVALAGPAVSFLLAGAFALVSMVMATVPGAPASLLGVFVASLMWANLMLAVFNLLPAFPMDGGRALRAWLARRRGHVAATQIAVKIGKVAALGLFAVGVLGNPWLILIAAFIWFAAGAELQSLRYRAGAAVGSRPAVDPLSWLEPPAPSAPPDPPIVTPPHAASWRNRWPW